MTFVDGGGSSTENVANDTIGFLINEAAKEELGEGAEIGEKLKSWMGTYEIVGVLKNFYYRPFDSKISPVVFLLERHPSRFLYVRYRPGMGSRALEVSQELWHNLSNASPVSYEYFEDDFNGLMKDQLESSRILVFFTLLFIITMIIGLIGLLGFTLKGLRKEIAIRKIVGGTSTGIAYLLSSRYLLLFGISLCFSIPASILFARYWLADFVYKTSIDYIDIMSSCIWIPLICFLLVVQQVRVSAKRSPVIELRVE